MRTRTAKGTVRFWLKEEGWGVLTSLAIAREIWVHFSAIEGSGHRDLKDGDSVAFRYRRAHQEEGLDGITKLYTFVADSVRRI